MDFGLVLRQKNMIKRIERNNAGPNSWRPMREKGSVEWGMNME